MKNAIATAGKELIQVLNPRGTPPPITLMPMAPRFDTLDGKTIYIIDVGFPLTEPFYKAAKNLLTERYPKTNWVVKSKVGAFMHDDPKLWEEIKQKGGAAIVGPGHMDTLGPAVVNWCASLEKLGVPTAPLISFAEFPELVRKAAYNKGVPNLRLIFMPYIVRMSAAACRKYLEGNDPITGKPVLKEIVDALTKPLTGDEIKKGVITRPVPRLLDTDTPENLQRLFLEKGWTDYLPIVLPTEKRVAEMLKGTSHKPDEIVGGMSPADPYETWNYTVEQVAVNAVMAGAKPEHFPVILTIASTGITSLASSIGSHNRMIVVNGPIRKEINMNSGIGALGPFNEANAVIGRAWTLISKNLGESGIPGLTYLGSFGNSYNYNNLCFAENEEGLPPGWKPLHVQKGYKQKDSAISIFTGMEGLIGSGGITKEPHHKILKRQLLIFQPSRGSTFYRGVGNFGVRGTTLMTPGTAKGLVNEGFETKEKLSQWLNENIFKSKSESSILSSPLTSTKSPEEAKQLQQLPGPAPQVDIIVVGQKTEAGLNMQSGGYSYIRTDSIDKWR
jgi:hypothetical protein